MSYWGNLWGGGTDAVGALWLRINRDVPNIGAIGDVIELFGTRILSTAAQIEGAFDLDTAAGHALDLWGVLLGQLRLGLGDADYRRLLHSQRQVVLAGASTRAKMIAVFEAWSSVTADYYRDSGRTVEVGGDIPAAFESRLLRLMARVVPAGRRVVVYHAPAGVLIGDYGLDPTGEATFGDYGLDPITGAAPLAERVRA